MGEDTLLKKRISFLKNKKRELEEDTLLRKKISFLKNKKRELEEDTLSSDDLGDNYHPDDLFDVSELTRITTRRRMGKILTEDLDDAIKTIDEFTVLSNCDRCELSENPLDNILPEDLDDAIKKIDDAIEKINLTEGLDDATLLKKISFLKKKRELEEDTLLKRKISFLEKREREEETAKDSEHFHATHTEYNNDESEKSSKNAYDLESHSYQNYRANYGGTPNKGLFGVREMSMRRNDTAQARLAEIKIELMQHKLDKYEKKEKEEEDKDKKQRHFCFCVLILVAVFGAFLLLLGGAGGPDGLGKCFLGDGAGFLAPISASGGRAEPGTDRGVPADSLSALENRRCRRRCQQSRSERGAPGNGIRSGVMLTPPMLGRRNHR